MEHRNLTAEIINRRVQSESQARARFNTFLLLLREGITQQQERKAFKNMPKILKPPRFDPIISLLGIYPKEIRVVYNKIAALNNHLYNLKNF